LTTTNLILIGVAVVAIFGAMGAFAIAFRRTSRDTRPDWESQVEPDARRADQSLRGVRVEPPVVAEQLALPHQRRQRDAGLLDVELELGDRPVRAHPLQQRVERRRGLGGVAEVLRALDDEVAVHHP